MLQSTIMPPTAPLDYARAPNPRRRWRRIFLTTFLLTLTLVAWHYHQPILDRSTVLIAQHRCMTYTAPPGQIVYESDSQRGSLLAAADKAFKPQYGGGLPSPGFARTVRPWEDLRAEFPDSLVRYSSAGLRPGSQSFPLFLHQRRAKDHENRLVVVDLYDGFSVRAKVIRSGTPWRKPQVIWRSPDSQEFRNILLEAVLLNDPNHLGVQIYAGQPDPIDESRFTISATVTGVNLRLRCQLLPDDTIQMELPDAEQTWEKILDNLHRTPRPSTRDSAR